MKKMLFGFSFVVALGGAFAFKPASPNALEDAYFRNPDVAHCTNSTIKCDITQVNPCKVTTNNLQGYRSGCSQILFKN